MEKENHILYRVEIDGNGVRDKHYEIAISNSVDKLTSYCKDTFKLPVGKPEKFSWDDYYIISKTNITIIN